MYVQITDNEILHESPFIYCIHIYKYNIKWGRDVKHHDVVPCSSFQADTVMHGKPAFEQLFHLSKTGPELERNRQNGRVAEQDREACKEN